MKKIKFLIFVFILFVFNILSLNIFAYNISKEEKVYVGGEAIGIKLNCGIHVVGTFGIEKDGIIYRPWYDAGITDGDIIMSINNIETKNKEDILNALYIVKNRTVPISFKRNNVVYTSNITPVMIDNNYTLGLYIKDSVVGLGTLTYYVKEANIYGSLGHKISDYSFTDGVIYEAKVTGIVKPTRNEAGQKKATINSGAIADISKNCDTGVYGAANNSFSTDNMQLLSFKTRDEVNLGDAEILTCIEGERVEAFKIKITSLQKQNDKDIKGISFRVVDDKLIKKTGGIIQGMSGSPIIQDNCIIGAVTHVSLNNSTVGYGIYIEWMFEEMGITVIE